MKKSFFFRAAIITILIVSLILPCTAMAQEEEPEVSALSALLVDGDTDTILYSKAIYERRYPASLTKIMTAMLALEAVDRGELSLDQKIIISDDIYDDVTYDAASVNLTAGEEVSILDVLYCLLLPSACEAANVLADAVSGNIGDFVELMNKRAAQIGMEDTHFVNAHGLHEADHYSTAWDLYLLSKKAMENETFREIVSTRSYTMAATNMNDERVLYNTNALISNLTVAGQVYSPAIGIKTGHTVEAGYCLSAAAEKNGRTQYCIILNDIMERDDEGNNVPLTFADATELMKWGFDNYLVTPLMDDTNPVAQVHVTLSDTDYVLLVPEETVTALLPADFDMETLSQSFEVYDEEVEAPVHEGDVLGRLTITGVDEENGEVKEYGSVNLVALNSVERSELRAFFDSVGKLFSARWFQACLIAFLIIVAMIVVIIIIYNRRKPKQDNPGSRK